MGLLHSRSYRATNVAWLGSVHLAFVWAKRDLACKKQEDQKRILCQEESFPSLQEDEDLRPQNYETRQCGRMKFPFTRVKAREKGVHQVTSSGNVRRRCHGGFLLPHVQSLAKDKSLREDRDLCEMERNTSLLPFKFMVQDLQVKEM